MPKTVATLTEELIIANIDGQDGERLNYFDRSTFRPSTFFDTN